MVPRGSDDGMVDRTLLVLASLLAVTSSNPNRNEPEQCGFLNGRLGIAHL